MTIEEKLEVHQIGKWCIQDITDGKRRAYLTAKKSRSVSRLIRLYGALLRKRGHPPTAALNERNSWPGYRNLLRQQQLGLIIDHEINFVCRSQQSNFGGRLL